MKSLITLLFTILIFQFGDSQSFEVINHNYPDFHDFPTTMAFAEDGDENIWLLQGGGFTGDVISRYNGTSWESIPFEDCSYCTYSITSHNNGTIYLSTNIGLYAFENESWVLKNEASISRADTDFDSSGNFWYTSNPKFLAYLDINGVANQVSEFEGNIDNLTVADNDVVWFYHDQKVVSYQNGTATTHDVSANHLEIDKDNNAWFIDFQGRIGKIEGDQISTDELSNADNGFQILSLAVDRKNNLLHMGQQGTDPGVMMVDLNTESNQLVDSDLLFPDEVALVNELFTASNGSVWVGANFSPNIAEIQPEIISSIKFENIELSFYPNPTSGVVTIDNQQRNDVSLKILSINGVLQTEILAPIGKSNVDLVNIANGYYLIGNNEIGFQKIGILK